MDDPIHLGRAPLDECAGVELMCQQCDPFPAQQIVAREDSTFTAVIGPSANPRGYTGITGNIVMPHQGLRAKPATKFIASGHKINVNYWVILVIFYRLAIEPLV